SIRNTLAYLRGGDWRPRLPSRVQLAFIGASLVLALVIFVLHLSVLAVFFPEFCAPDNVFQECAALERILVAIPTGFALGWVGGIALYVLILPVLSLLRRLSPPSIVPAAVPQGQNIAPNVSTEVHEA